jgi:serine/threonine protein kinase
MNYKDLIGYELYNGKYKVVSFIGMGGMSAVYEGVDTRLKRKVAIKVLRFDYINNLYQVRKFNEEAQIAAECDHPNIVGIYDIQEEGYIHYISMQFLPKSLPQLLKQKKVLTSIEAVTILKPIAVALAYLHKKRIVHRDIKLSNIMFDDHNNPVLTDFGIAMRDDTTRVEETTTGTAEYMSPEQIIGGVVDFHSDIYSLGIVLYELVTGDVPFKGDNYQTIFYQHRNQPVPEKLLDDFFVPKRIKEIIFKCLEKTPNDRYETTGDLVGAFDDIIRNPPTPRAKRLKPKRVKIGILMPIMLLIIIAVSAAVFPQERKEIWQYIKDVVRILHPPSRLVTILNVVVSDSTENAPVPFPGEILIKSKKAEINDSVFGVLATVILSDDIKQSNQKNKKLDLTTISLYYPENNSVDTIIPIQIIAHIPYYRFIAKETVVVTGKTTNVQFYLKPLVSFCSKDGYQFKYGETNCPNMHPRQKWPEK